MMDSPCCVWSINSAFISLPSLARLTARPVGIPLRNPGEPVSIHGSWPFINGPELAVVDELQGWFVPVVVRLFLLSSETERLEQAVGGAIVSIYQH